MGGKKGFKVCFEACPSPRQHLMWAGARLSLSPENKEREAEKTDSRGTLSYTRKKEYLPGAGRRRREGGLESYRVELLTSQLTKETEIQR